jgi:hypothetical protein
VIVWLNGTFGVGRTTTSGRLAGLLPGARIFDPENVGYTLRPVLDGIHARDFQDHPPWRSLVVATATEILRYVGGTLIIPQSVLVRPYWAELSSGFAEAGIPVRHFLLHADPAEPARRIAADADTPDDGARKWRLGHIAAYEAALPWLREEGEVVDTMTRDPDEAARHIARSLAA